MNSFLKKAFAGAAFMALTGTAMASGPKYTEMGDAGDLPGGAQAPMGNGVLLFINGSLGMAVLSGEVDVVDMYLINIVDPEKFRITTDPEDEIGKGMPFAQFDTQLWLFQPALGNLLHAEGLLGNDDHFELGGPFSLLLPDPTDGFPVGLVKPGLYYLAITRFHDPFSNGGEIFFQEDPQEISGPDGPGGKQKIIAWDGDQGGIFDGEYRMALQGVEYAKSPISCPWDLDGSGIVGAADLLALLFDWGPCKDCAADFDDDGIVGASDLLAMLFNWGPCP
ncbi:MAG: hypothetical protein V3T53_00395 [Phycisphaerales bacterium]